MERWSYLAVLAACLVVTAPLEFLLGARVYRQPRRLAATVLPVAAVFATWDLIATARGHWWFSEQYTLGIHLAGLPLEEWLFFFVIPICAVLTYEAVGRAVGTAVGSVVGTVRRRVARRGEVHRGVRGA